MKSVLFTIPMKTNALDDYLAFIKEVLQQDDKYRDMLKRYDIRSAKAWIKRIGDVDYVFVYHDVGPSFEDKIKGWDTSEHPYDKWFNDQIMQAYDVENVEGMESPKQVLEFDV